MKWMLAVMFAVAACKGGSGSPSGSGGAHEGSNQTAGGGAKAGNELVTNQAGPEGVKWKRTEFAWGSVELPDGEGWTLDKDEPAQIEHTDGTVVMLQSQTGIEPDQISDYLVSYDEVQKRDAPKYAETARVVGSVKGTTAARVEGTFDNGTKFVTHDLLMITKTNTVVLIGGRMPAGPGPNTRLALLVDHIAATAQVK